MEESPKFEEEEDIHICGSCGAQFSNVDYFISHKKLSCPVRLARRQNEQGQTGQSRSKVKSETTEEGQVAIDTVIQETVEPLVDNIQPSYDEAEPVQYIETVCKDQEPLGYLQETPEQTGSQETTPSCTQFVTQSDYIHEVPEQIGSQENTPSCTQFVTQSDYSQPDNDGSNNTMAHEYVLLSGPASEEAYTGQDQTFDPQASTETVYTLDSHTLQAGLTSIAEQPMSTQGADNYFQTSITGSQPVTVQSDLVTQTGSTTLQITNPTLLAEPDNQSALERAIVATELDVNQSTAAVSVAVQDGFVTSSEPNTEIHYTLSLDPQGRAQVSAMKVNDLVNTAEYEARAQQSAQDIQGLKVDDIVKPGGYDQDIQYTLSTVQQSTESTGTEDVVIVEQNVVSQPESRLEAKLKSLKPTPVKKVGSSPVKKSKAQLDKKFKCEFPECKFKTAYLKDLERHHRIHTGEKPFRCTKCDKSFNRNDKLVLHMRYHLNERAFKCQLCDYSAVEKGSLKKHMKIHLDERPFSCQVCPYKSRSASQLQIHLRTHTGDMPYECRFCAAKFKVSSDLKRHMRTHTGEKPFACQYLNCPYRCAIKSNLRSHYKTHHKIDQELRCDDCDFKTSSKRTLFEHKKSHNPQVDLICDNCGYQCSNRSALKNHLKMHNGFEERFKCNHCKYSSVQSGNVQSHMKRKHPTKITRKLFKKTKLVDKFESKIVPAVPEDSSEEKLIRGNVRTKCLQNFKCTHCSAAFVREDSLKCHIKQHKDSSLSTAYAVLKLQQPVINSSTGQAASTNSSDTQSSNLVSSSVYLQEQTRGSTEENRPPILFTDGSFQTASQATTIQNPTVNLGINDILMAAGVSTLSSTGDSPTSKRPLLPAPLQDSPPADTIVAGTSALSPNTSPTEVLLGQSPNDVPSLQVMQNISLPYIRLPNGQVLILTGQNSLGQLVTQSDNLGQPELTPGTGQAQVPTQIFAQQPTTEQQQLIHSPADSTSPNSLAPQISAPQQPGAIPIQIILPNDSQQAIPLVTQLLNSVISRGGGAYEGQLGTSGQVTSTSPTKLQGTSGTQNLILQIPSQSGAAKDSDESQQFVLQISGQGNLG